MIDDSKYTIAGIPILKAVAFSSGDGWKDSTTAGQNLYVWGVLMSPPYVANSCPRIGRGTYTYAVSPELHSYRYLKEDEFYQFKTFFENSPALQDELRHIREGIANGDFLEIPDLRSFIDSLKPPKEGGLKGRERLGIKEKTESKVVFIAKGGRI